MTIGTCKSSTFRLLAVGMGLFACGALGQGVPLDLSLESQLFQSELLTTEARQLKEARLNSGLGLNMGNPLLAVDVNYRLGSVLREKMPESQQGLSQQVNARLSSARLNEFLGVDAGVKADSVSRVGRDGFRHRVSPGLSHALGSLARLSLNYDYVLDKPADKRTVKEKRGYSMALDGGLGSGRLTWSGSYRNTSEFDDGLVFSRAVESMDIKSRYLIMPSMHLELTSAIRQETRPAGPGEDVFMQRRYGAAFGWKPSPRYSLGFRLNSLEDERLQRQDTVGSGSVSWFPLPDLELTLDYGESAARGEPGWMLHTRLDLSG